MALNTGRIRERRQQLGLSQQELAEQIGIEQAALSKIESDKGNPTATNLLRLAEALDCSVDWLLGRVSDTTTLEAQYNEIEHEVLLFLRSKPIQRQKQLLEIWHLIG